jgi:hypothetical protein
MVLVASVVAVIDVIMAMILKVIIVPVAKAVILLVTNGISESTERY